MKDAVEKLKVALLAAIVFTPGESARGDDWQGYQHDAQHTGRSTAAFDPTQLAFSWKAPTGYATPVIVGNQVFATRSGGGTGTYGCKHGGGIHLNLMY